MKVFNKNAFFLAMAILGFTAIYVSSCKKIDLKRIAVIATESVTNVTTSTAEATGNVIDAGSNLTDYGFCWATSGTPTINDSKASAGKTANTGEFSLQIAGLQQNTTYTIRSYIIDESGVTYGVAKNFKTQQQSTGGAWWHYDSGENQDGIGFTEGGDWDVAIRIPSSALQNYNGYSVSKIRFFPLEGTVASYHVTIWEGDTPDLMYYEIVPNPVIGSWTEFNLPTPYLFDISKDLWVGYWIYGQPASTYPAGVDNGPADTGYGDLYSNDEGLTWKSLSLIDPPNLDYNWNIQVYVENSKGEALMLPTNLNRQNTSNSEANNIETDALPQSKKSNSIN